MPGLLQSVEAPEDVVAVDVGDPQVVTVAGDRFAGGGGQPGGVEPSGVDDELDPVGDEEVQCRVEVLQEGGRIALGAVFGARLTQNQHRDLGEVVTGEDVDAAGSSHLGHGRSPVTVEARAVPDADGTLPSACCCHVVAPVVLLVLLTRTVPSNPTSPEGCCSISSRTMLSPSATVTRAV